MIEQELSNAQYHADREYVSKTWLDKINRSPAHLKAYLDGFSSFQSPAMALGSLVHEAVLEPELFESKYCIEPITIASSISIFPNFCTKSIFIASRSC